MLIHPSPVKEMGRGIVHYSLFVKGAEVAMIWKRSAVWVLGIASLLFAACWNPFAPDTTTVIVPPVILPPLTSPENVFENLDYAMNQKDIELYEDIVDDAYWFFSPSQIDTLDCAFDKTEDVTLTGRVFEYFETVEYELMETGAHWIEYGANVAPEGATDISDEHPDENWEVFQRPVTMYLLDESGTEGWFVQSDFEFKMKKQHDPDTGEPILDPETKAQIWKIVRWTEYTG